MRFLVDAQLPPGLARWLAAQGHQAEHVLDLGMQRSADQAIWRHAWGTGAVLVTKDEDFANLTALDPHGPPVVWVRTGNTTRRALLATFQRLLPTIGQKLLSGERLIEVQ